jgi:parvulin-like peptidyl-prolyl isomerase
MSGRLLCGPAWAVLLAGACGCGSGRAMAVAPDLDLARAIAAAGVGKAPDDVARAQMPENQSAPRTAEKPPDTATARLATPRTLVRPLDVPPERPAAVAGAPTVARICATVNGEAVLEEEVRAACYQSLVMASQLPPAQRAAETNKIINTALTQIIEREIVIQEMNTRFEKHKEILNKLKEAAGKEFDRQVLKAMRESGKFPNEEAFRDYFRSQGMSLELVRRQWERNFMMVEYLRQRVWDPTNRIGHPEILAYYETHPEEFKVDDNVVWQDIFIDASRHKSREAARAYAQALAERIRKGEDFATLAKQYDNGASSTRDNAEGIGRRQHEIRPPEAADELFRLRDGEVGRLIEIPTGFHIVRAVKREFAGQHPFDEKVQKDIRDKLRNEISQREMKRIVTELKRTAIIEYAGGR